MPMRTPPLVFQPSVGLVFVWKHLDIKVLCRVTLVERSLQGTCRWIWAGSTGRSAVMNQWYCECRPGWVHLESPVELKTKGNQTTGMYLKCSELASAAGRILWERGQLWGRVKGARGVLRSTLNISTWGGETSRSEQQEKSTRNARLTMALAPCKTQELEWPFRALPSCPGFHVSGLICHWMWPTLVSHPLAAETIPEGNKQQQAACLLGMRRYVSIEGESGQHPPQAILCRDDNSFPCLQVLCTRSSGVQVAIMIYSCSVCWQRCFLCGTRDLKTCRTQSCGNRKHQLPKWVNGSDSKETLLLPSLGS